MNAPASSDSFRCVGMDKPKKVGILTDDAVSLLESNILTYLSSNFLLSSFTFSVEVYIYLDLIEDDMTKNFFGNLLVNDVTFYC